MKHYIHPTTTIIKLETTQILAASQLEFGGSASAPRQEPQEVPESPDPWSTSWE